MTVKKTEKCISGNLQKYENYKEQFTRLERALKERFYLEAIFIEYAILEDRTSSILRYENNSVNTKDGREPSIDRKLRKIKDIAREKKGLPKRYFSDELIDQILAWKEERNRMIHALLKQQLTTEELRQIAKEGKVLARTLSNKANSYKKAVEKKERTINKKT